MSKKKRKVGQINASSMADISFLLLIFFLVTTSMNVGTGIARRLPPPLPPDQKPPDMDIKKRNIFIVRINSQNQIMAQGEILDIKQLRYKTKEFIKNENNDPNLPELITENIPLLGEVTYTKNHVISLQNDVGTQYQAYIDVQNELIAAYNELRDEFAMQRFGKKYNELSQELQEAVQKIYPQKISEAEPKNYGGVKSGKN
ncbi:MAG TPA: biopolymer transporter ExbD [Paludibacteraceae bacterium]|jgi:biopolymer transport protein ExbD|nr:biopolymer transporter ExbD [Paludibacteraceae bacterium]OPZ03146.1 MAG: Biopolymer transport protein ExbD/TolR [Bacteroidetes bacterium ADurb.BinA395]MBP8966354.1 biopolymer transporter ExbD [Paludibacteraceae bacterium]HOF98285.1 biopolymer transporter ExbD [Paludibacteraceae bacterium]HOJ65623.1 biopolymer transporter ExbD [Paludibacteraceae bacterium]